MGEGEEEGEVMTDLAELTQSFQTYYEEIDRCLNAKCYWSLVHLLVVLPAVCAAMETQSGDAEGNEYMNWCRRYFDKDPRFTDKDRYGLRVALLHQGRTTVEERGQYRSYSFVPPTGHDVHLTVRDFGADGKNLTIDVARLADETKRAMQKWFNDQKDTRRANIGPNLRWLAREGRAEIPGAPGVVWNVPTTSSTGGMGR